MRVYYDGGLVINIAENEIRRLSAYARKGYQFLHCIRHDAAMFRQKHLSAFHDVSCLGAEKTAGMDVPLHFLHIRFRKCLKGRKTRIERGRHLIDALVCTLGGKADSEQQLICFFIIQRTLCQRIFLLQLCDDFIV